MKAKIMKAALDLFTTRGYFNTSVHDIRKAADVSIGAVYYHFRSKEEIANAIYNDLLDRMADTLKGIKKRYGATADRCRAIMEALFEMTEASPREMEFMLYAKHREFMVSAVPICSSQPFTMMREIVLEGIEGGELRNLDLTIVTTCIFGAMFRMINLRLDGVIADPLPEHLQEIWAAGWRSMALR